LRFRIVCIRAARDCGTGFCWSRQPALAGIVLLVVLLPHFIARAGRRAVVCAGSRRASKEGCEGECRKQDFHANSFLWLAAAKLSAASTHEFDKLSLQVSDSRELNPKMFFSAL
jgi:hypothetical protein